MRWFWGFLSNNARELQLALDGLWIKKKYAANDESREQKRMKKIYIPHHLYTQERNLLEATTAFCTCLIRQILIWFPWFWPANLYIILSFSFLLLYFCVAFFPFFVLFLRCFRYFVTRGGLILFQPVLNFLSLVSPSLLLQVFLKRRVFWALELFWREGRKRGKGKMEAGGPLFFCDFFSSSLFLLGIFPRKTEILKSWREKKENRLVGVCYGDACVKIGGNYVKTRRLFIL